VTDSSKTLIAAVLDRSGSMQSSVSATQEGFDELINGQKKEPGSALVTLTQFDDVYEVVYTNKPIDEVPKLSLVPRGMTAMLDGIGKLITETGAELAKLPEDERPGTVICLIMTDGGENSSREWTWAKVKELITEHQEKYSWKFIFIGANINAEAVGGNLGLNRDQVMQFNSHDHLANRSVYASVSNYTSQLRGGASVAVAAAAAFTPEARLEAMGDELPPQEPQSKNKGFGKGLGRALADSKK
jgi:hypothetical protein